MKLHPGWMAPALLAIPLFAVTNADDLVLLTIFFSNPRVRAATIVIGQLVGIGALTLASILVARVAVQLPQDWLPLLGLAPIALGVRQFFAKGDDEDGNVSSPKLNWWVVATITIANGGDNLGVYIPVFTMQTSLGIAIISAMFAVLTFAWCGLAAGIVRHPKWGAPIRSVTSRAAPYVFIGVGVWILAKHAAIQALFG